MNNWNTINRHYKIFSTYHMFNIDKYISTQLDQTVFTACLTIFASSFCCMQHTMSLLAFQLVSLNPPWSPSSSAHNVPPSLEPAMAPPHLPIWLALSPYLPELERIHFLCPPDPDWHQSLMLVPLRNEGFLESQADYLTSSWHWRSGAALPSIAASLSARAGLLCWGLLLCWLA